MNFYYKIYGLEISSSRRISILRETANLNTDLSVIWTTDPSITPYENLKWERILTADLQKRRGISFFSAQSEEGVYSNLCFETENGNMNFLVDPKKQQLWIIHEINDLENDLDSYFVGPVLGCILRLKGILCLHGSVVNIDGKAVAFLGNKRSGKSTTAAGFARMGFNILTDDMAVITVKDNKFYLEPGYPKVRLRPASVAAMYPEDADLPMVFTTRDSRYSNIENNFCETALPLGAIYLLSKSDEYHEKPFIEPIVLHERLVQLGKNTFGNYVITPGLRKQEFELLSLLALNIQISRLQVVYDLQKLNSQCEAVIEDFRQTVNI